MSAKARWWLIVGGVLLALLLFAAYIGPAKPPPVHTPIKDACYAKLRERANSLPYQMTAHEQEVFYSYCIDVSEGRVPTERPVPAP